MLRVSGNATYRERMLLPPGSVLQVTVEDVSRADAPAEVLGRTEVQGRNAPPIPFVVEYPAAKILPGHRYGVRARITQGENLLFVTDTFIALPGSGESSPLELRLVRTAQVPPAPAAPAPASTAQLENTYWKLLQLGSAAVRIAERQREPHLILQAPDEGTRRVTGFAGCNRMMGSYTLEGDRIEFKQLAGTLMACAEGMETETAFHQALLATRRWAIRGEQLDLFDAEGARVALFESVYLR